LKTNTKLKSNFKRQIQQGLFEYNIYRQKIKNPAKIRRPTYTPTLWAVKVDALRVFAIISTLRYAQVVFWQKNLDSPIRPPI